MGWGIGEISEVGVYWKGRIWVGFLVCRIEIG